MKSLLIKSAIASGVVLSLATFTRPVMASSFTVSIENAGVQNAQSSNLVNGHVQTFDAQTAGSTAGFQSNDGTTNVGSYKTTLIQNADQYGGAGGTGKYFDVNANISGQTVSSLNLTNPESYFGLWWSAGDASNVLTFLSKGVVVETITTADVVSYIGKLANKASYYGNPNSTNQNTGEPYAFINFYDVAGSFDQVQFSNIGGNGFESDNHTVATSYKTITGNIVITAVPESSSVLGVLVIGFVGASSVMTRRVNKKSVLQLS
ncbi:MAG: Npun_F0296 family exosortase-dependent surface protein [Nostoc sp.]